MYLLIKLQHLIYQLTVKSIYLNKHGLLLFKTSLYMARMKIAPATDPDDGLSICSCPPIIQAEAFMSLY